jgi:TPR repeat protein
MIDPTWEIRATLLAKAGDRQKAYDVLSEAAAAGRIDALVRLARMQFMNAEYVEADETIRKAALRVRDSDFETHWQLHLAYTLGVGELDTEERWRLAFEHLTIAAALEQHEMLLLAVAYHYEQGLNGVQPDLAEAEKWFARAADMGSSNGAAAYKRLLRQKKPPGVRPNRDA